MKRDEIDRNEKRARHRVNMRRHRSTVRRFDYAPCATALSAIEAAHAAGLDATYVGTLDRLVLAGAGAISGIIKDPKP